MHSEGTMPYSLKGLPSTETEFLTTLIPRLKNEKLKFVVQQSQDTCIPHIFIVVFLNSRLGRSQLKNDEKVQCRVLLYATLVNYLGDNALCSPVSTGLSILGKAIQEGSLSREGTFFNAVERSDLSSSAVPTGLSICPHRYLSRYLYLSADIDGVIGEPFFNAEWFWGGNVLVFSVRRLLFFYCYDNCLTNVLAAVTTFNFPFIDYVAC